MNAIPTRLEEVRKNAQSLEQQFNAAYEKLKVDLGCPDGYEVDLETGEMLDPNKPIQTPEAQ
jgi:hypothetical protein